MDNLSGRPSELPPASQDVEVATNAMKEALVAGGLSEFDAQAVIENSGLAGMVGGEDLPVDMLELLTPEQRRERAEDIGLKLAQNHLAGPEVDDLNRL